MCSGKGSPPNGLVGRTRAVSLRAWSCPSVTAARRRQLVLVFVQNLHGCRQREFRLHACDWGKKII
jgi:hypothetical protein